MGDPKKIRKKYSTPAHPWEKSRIDEEREITKNYALNNKKEIWKMSTMLKKFKEEAKKLGSLSTKQADKERKQLLSRLKSIGLLEEDSSMEAILTLQMQDILERRLQTIVHKKGLARTMKQARQFITHGHIKIGSRVINSPSYIVRKKEENSISFKDKSSLANPDNPERKIMEKPKKKGKSEKGTKKEKEKNRQKKDKSE
ncbi:30S ribosomal protein S4 [Candidatus Woesearchaeota archaeon]|nr:30S ribosomal protein S4 [Candidatus Woesearchaeota archaeon]